VVIHYEEALYQNARTQVYAPFSFTVCKLLQLQNYCYYYCCYYYYYYYPRLLFNQPIFLKIAPDYAESHIGLPKNTLEIAGDVNCLLFLLSQVAYNQWLRWSREAGRGSPDEARLEQTPYPFPTQLIWSYLGIK